MSASDTTISNGRDEDDRKSAAGGDPGAASGVGTGLALLAIEATRTVPRRIEALKATANAGIGKATVATAAGAPAEITTETTTAARIETKEVTVIGTVSGSGNTAVASVMNLLMANASRTPNDAEMTRERGRMGWRSTKTPQVPIKARRFPLARLNARNVNVALRPDARVENVVRTIALLAMMNVTDIGIEAMTDGLGLAGPQITMNADVHTIGIILLGASLLVIGDLPPQDDDSEARSVFVSQLAARLTARDLGYFFEDKLGEGTVRDSRIVTDRISRRSKGIAYVELASIELVQKAIALTGTVVMGLPIMVQLTESERNKQAPAGDSLNLPPGVNAPPAGMQLYVGSLHFNLTESDIKQVFEPFGELDFVDLHKDPQTGRSKGYAFVQYVQTCRGR
ncbi:hypothetical protein FRC00_004289 [Tulasnella sp. 408]|nr:hypothetical protein FRC00_004289 [Tulasnella sp. 408]